MIKTKTPLTIILSVILLTLAACPVQAQAIDCNGADYLVLDGISTDVLIENQSFTNCNRIVNAANAPDGINITLRNITVTDSNHGVYIWQTDQDLGRVVIEDSIFTGIDAVAWLRSGVGSFFAIGNTVNGARSEGFRIGANDIQDRVGNVHAIGNQINNVISASGPAYGVIVYGQNVVIADNVIAVVRSDDPAGGCGNDDDGDAAGIYTKAGDVRITGNTLTDAGATCEGSIVVKGGSGSGATEIAYNTISFSPGLAGYGISVHSIPNGAFAHHNTVTGANRAAIIRSDSGGVIVSGNVFTDNHGAVLINKCASGCTVSHNTISGVTEYPAIEINVNKPVSVERLLISGNTISGYSASQPPNNSRVAIKFRVNNGGTIGGVGIVGNDVGDPHLGINGGGEAFSGLHIIGNDLSGTNNAMTGLNSVVDLYLYGNIE